MELAKTLETKVKNYLRLQSRERIALKTLLTGLSECLPETVIFGGMLREFA